MVRENKAPAAAYLGKHSRIVNLGAEVFWIALGQVLAAFGAIFSVRLLTQTMLPQEYGALALGMTMIALVQQVVSGPLSNATLRFFPASVESQSVRAYIVAMKALLMLGGLIMIPLLLVLSFAMQFMGTAISPEFIVATVCFALFSSISGVLDSIQNAAKQRAIVAWHQASFIWLRLIIALWLMRWLGSRGAIAMIGYAAASAIVCGSQYYFFRRVLAPLVTNEPAPNQANSLKYHKDMKKYAAPFTKWGLVTWAYSSSDRWSLNYFSGKSTVGLYSAVYQLGYYPIMLLTSLLHQLVAPHIYEQAGNNSDSARMSKVRELTLLMVLLLSVFTIIMFVVAMSCHEQVFRFLAAPDYKSISYLFPWMVLASGLFAVGQFASLVPQAEMRPQDLVHPKIFTALIGIVLNIVAAHQFGVQGVVGASVVFSILYALWTLKLAYKSSAQHCPRNT